jgi:hypothetical protein
MPRCYTRIAPFNIWNIEEKVAWADRIESEIIRIESNTQRMWHLWHGKNKQVPIERDWQRAIQKQTAAEELTEREEAILTNCVWAWDADFMREQSASLQEAHEQCSCYSAEPFGLDIASARMLCEEAVADQRRR